MAALPAYVTAAAAVFPASLALTRVVIHVTQKRGWVVKPKADRWSQTPTALYGGIAIAVSFLVYGCALLADSGLRERFDLIGLILGCAMIFALGLKDDIKPLNPLVKLIGQVMAVTPFLIGLLLVDRSVAMLLSIPVLMAWMVLLTNSLNLLDNMDGLSAGTATVIGSLTATFAFMHGQIAVGALSAGLVLACLGFLVFNFRPRGPAHIFMGDCGSMLLGYALAGLIALGVTPIAGDRASEILLPALLMAVPLFDTTLVVIRRKREGRAISQGGRDHASHRLVYAGLTDKRAVLTLCLIGLVTGGVGVLLESLNQPLLVVVASALFFYALVRFGAYLAGFVGPSLAVVQPVRESRVDASSRV